MGYSPTILTVLVAVLLSSVARGATPASAAGVYRGSSGIETRTVTLLANGRYLARWDGDVGSNGSSTGTWELVNSEVRLSPKKEDGMIAGYFRVLLLREFQGQQGLLRKEDAGNADNEFFYLFRKASPPPPAVAPSPLEARRNFHTHLLRRERMGEEPEVPPVGLLNLVRYPAPLGKNAAYVGMDPKDGKKHPAIIWLVGGFSNSIGRIAWTPAPKSNDQSAAGFRERGIVMMYPSLRGGNDSPGEIETFYGEVDDVLAAAKYLAGLPYVDPERIYLGGHSTGGTLVLLVAASAAPGQFRAAFALGPVNEVVSYGADVLPFDLADPREGELRAPQRFLDSIRCPTFVFEGTKAPSNIGPLVLLRARSKNPLIQFYPVEGQSHFSLIAPTVAELARCILADDKKTAVFRYEKTAASDSK